jgi:cation:H+ antiporter
MYFLVISGFILLLFGAEIMLRGAIGIADKLHISKLLVGTTIVAFGTSSPEFLVSLNAALSGSSALAIGNVVGSNISNILLVTGVAALLMPIIVKKGDFKQDGWMLLVGTVLFLILAFRSEIDLFAGFLLLFYFISFLSYSYLREKRRFRETEDLKKQSADVGSDNLVKLCVYLFLGFGGLIYGAQILVEGGVEIARKFSVSEAVIGLTIMALGTSLPELAATVVAAIRKQSDVALGNIVGSNIFNVVGIVGVVSIVTPLSIPARVINLDVWVLLAATLLLMPYMIGRLTRLGRSQALLMLFAYLTYIASISYGIESLMPR